MDRVMKTALLVLLLFSSIAFAQVMDAQVQTDQSQIILAPQVSTNGYGFNFSKNAFLQAIASSGAPLSKTISQNNRDMTITMSGQAIVDMNVNNSLGNWHLFQGQLRPTFTDCNDLTICKVYSNMTFTVPFITSGISDFTTQIIGDANAKITDVQYGIWQNISSTSPVYSLQNMSSTIQGYTTPNGTIVAPQNLSSLQQVQTGTSTTMTPTLVWQSIKPGQVFSGTMQFIEIIQRSQPNLEVDIQPGFLNQTNQRVGTFSAWNYYATCQVNSTVGATLNNFPARCDMNTTNSTLFDSTVNCSNIRFTQDNNTALPYEMDENSSTYCGPSSTKNGTFWVLANLTASAISNITVWMGNIGTTNGQQPPALWHNASYWAVFHMDQVNSSSLIDSTLNNNLTLNGVGCYNQTNATSLAIGDVGFFQGGLSVTGACSYRTSTPVGGPSGASKSTETVRYSPGGNAGDYWSPVYSLGAIGDQSNVRTFLGNGRGGQSGFMNYYGTTYFVNTAWSSGWKFDSTMYDGSSVFLCVGTTCGSAADALNTATTGLVVGGYWGSESLNGWIDEVRFANTTRTAAWLSAEANMTNNVTAVTNNNPANTTTMATVGTGVNPINQNSLLSWNASASTSLGTFQGFNCTSYNNTVNVSSINFACNGGFCLNNTPYGVLNQSPSIYGVGDQAILSCKAYSTNNFANSTYLNSSTYTVLDNVPQFSNLMVNPNSTTSTIYPNMTINGNLTGQGNNTNFAGVVSFSWYKSTDGGLTYVNQTALAGTFTAYNNTPNWTGLNLLSVGTNPNDLWKFGAQLNDSYNWSINLNTSATLISGDITNLTMNTTYTQEYDLIKWGHGLNFTTAPGVSITSVSAGYGGSTYLATLASSSGGALQFNISIQPPFTSTSNSYAITWTINGVYANGSVFTQVNTTNTNNSDPYTITVNASGVYPCGSNSGVINTNSLNYSFYDVNSSASINATLTTTFNITSANGSIKVLSFSETNNTLQVCLAPIWGSFPVSIGEIANASNYITGQTGRALTASSTENNISIYLLPNTLAEATILTVNNFPNIPIPNAFITIEQFIAPSNYTYLKSCSTGGDGTCLVYLTPNLVYYRYNVSALSTTTSYGPEILTCAPGAPNCFRTFVLNFANLPYQTVGNFSGSCGYNNATGVLTCVATDLGSTIKNWNISTTFINGTQYCINSSGSSTALLTCSFDTTTPNIYGFGFNGFDANGNQYPISTGQVVIPASISDSFGRSGWLALLLLFGVIAMAGFQSPGLSIVLGIAALIFGGLIGLVPIISIQSAVIAAAVMAGILMWKMRV